MLGLLTAIVISWLLLWVTTKEHFSVLGLKPSVRRLKDFILAMLFAALVCGIFLWWQSTFQQLNYQINSDYDIGDFFNGSVWVFRAVLFEEFIFRGALLYLLIRKVGVVRACLIDAVAFGIYHWFSYEMFWRIIPMVYVFILTGVAGWMFAYSFAKTKSMYAPIGLHFGWIFVTIIVFSKGPLGNQWLISSSEPIELGGWATLWFFLWQALVAPVIVTWYLRSRD